VMAKPKNRRGDDPDADHRSRQLHYTLLHDDNKQRGAVLSSSSATLDNEHAADSALCYDDQRSMMTSSVSRLPLVSMARQKCIIQHEWVLDEKARLSSKILKHRMICHSGPPKL
jgi:hypothetical protein